MCGIAGLVALDPRPLAVIQSMIAVQAHRGPDGEGFMFWDGASTRFSSAPSDASRSLHRIALGHRRLAILDTSEAGIQPMASRDGHDWVIFNGEIYNYRELRSELEGHGFAFCTGTDTEVLLAAYRHWGTGCFQRLNGMWSVAIWDGRSKRLVLSRDRFGVKPLHFTRLPWGIAFSSEIKALLLPALTPARLNPQAAADFLKWGMVNHQTQTFFSDIASFPAAHFAEIDPDRPHRLEPVCFWELRVPRAAPRKDFAEASSEFRALFLSSVALRMRSDVPVGSCLSGGLDSSAIVMTAARTSEPLAGAFKTFTARSRIPLYDEGRYADAVSRAVGAHPVHVYPEQDRFIMELPQLVWHQEEPFTTASIYAQWCVMRAAREARVPVLLDGQGGDEVLCGYRKFYMFFLRQLARDGKWLRLLSESAQLLMRGDRGMRRWREGMRYLPDWLRRRQSQAEAVLCSSFRSQWDESKLELGASEDLRERQKLDLLHFSVPSLLRYEDRNSMAWSIESRVPFLDYRLAEYAVALAPELKLRGGKTKAILRSALADVLPQEVLARRDKMGFVSTPQEEWLAGRLGTTVLARLHAAECRLRGILNPTAVANLLKEALAGPTKQDLAFVFRAYVLDVWMERFNVVA